MKKIIKVFIITLLILLSIFLILIWINEKSNNSSIMNFNAPKSVLSYEDAIDSIDKEMVELTAVSDLLGNNIFLSLITYSDENLPEAINYLSNSLKNEQAKLIVVYSMQNLSYKNYLLFFDSCSKMYKEGKLNENIMLHVIIPGTDWNNKIVNSFYKLNVRRTLKKLRSINRNSEDLNNVIDQTLNGKLWWQRLTK